MNSSPYIISNWVKDPHFYGRATLCQELGQLDERCVYLVGTRRVGKTSLLLRLAEQLSPHAIYCDLMQASGGEGLDEARLVYLMRRQLGRLAARSDALAATRAAWDREADGLCAWLEGASWQWAEQNITITLLWDEAELLRRLPNSTLMPLRAILQHNEGLRIIVSASKALADLNDRWRGEFVSPFLFGFRTHPLAGLDDAEAEQLIRQRGAVQATTRTVHTIRAWTGNHPFLLQMLCNRLYRDNKLREPVRADLIVDQTLADMFRIDVSYLSPGEQAILGALAQGGPLRAPDLQRLTGFTDETLHSFADGMAQLGLVQALPDHRWRVGNDYLAQWLRSQPAATPSVVTDQASLEVNAAAPLSDREMMVLRLVAAGMSNLEIGRELSIAIDTVKAHLKHIFSKFGVNSRAQAVARARDRGIL